MREPESPVRSDYERYSTPDPESMEHEVADFIVALVHMMKPDTIVELGTYRGILAARIGEALRDEGVGQLHTFEVVGPRVVAARTRCVGLPVTCHHMAADSAVPADYGPIDLLIVDAQREDRVKDYLRWGDQLARFGVAALHDSLKYDPPLGELRALSLIHQMVTFKTPRGITLIQRIEGT